MTQPNEMPKANNTWAAALRGDQPIADVLKQAAAHKPAAAASKTILRTPLLPSMHVGRGIRYGNLTWFPIFTDAPVAPRNYITQATNGKLTVVENDHPTVGELQIKNDLDLPVLLFEGSLLEGGWQHRALTHTVFMAAKTEATIPVVCVEMGRWNGVSTQRLGNKLAPARVRRAMRGIEFDQNGKAVQSTADQQQVWYEIDAFATVINKPGRVSDSLADIKDEFAADIEGLTLEPATPIFGQRGVLVAVAGKPLALEVFDHPDTLAERLPAILDAYLAESLAKPYVECRSQLARDFVARVEKLGVETTEHAGRLRNKADKYVASEAVVRNDGTFLHLATLNAQHELVLAA